MAENKKGFVLYADQKHIFDKLTDGEAGKLIKHIFKYVNDENPIMDDRFLDMAFEPIKLQLKRDLKKYNEIKLKRSEIGKLGGIKSGEVRKQNEANEANASKLKQNEANEAVIVTVNDTVNDTVNVKDKLINSIDVRKLKFADTLKPFLETYGKDLLNEFYKYWTEPNRSNTRFRMELQKTWSLERRLETWARNDKNFNLNKTNVEQPKKRHQPLG